MTRTGADAGTIHCFGGSDDDKGQGQCITPGDTTDNDRFIYSLTNPPGADAFDGKRFLAKRLKRE
jgi:hypothetical protein